MYCCYAISIYRRRGELLIPVHGKYLGGKCVRPGSIMIRQDTRTLAKTESIF